MGGYFINFIVYTAAMVGVIFLAVYAYKKFAFTSSSQSRFLNVEDCISLAPRKNLYIVRAGSERFLIASDVDRTSLISKLGSGQKVTESIPADESVKSGADDLPTIMNYQKKFSGQKKVFKNIINNI